MILYRAIKYVILDICLESLFSALYRNLNNYKNKNRMRLRFSLLYKGLSFSKMVIWKGMWFTEILDNCTVMHIEETESNKWNLGITYILHGITEYREFTGLDDRWIYICE